jgi:hypothetical protein
LKLRSPIIALAFGLLAACAGGDTRIANTLDPETGITITYCRTPFVFYREDSGKAAHARNLVHLGPVEVNRSGDFRYFIWLGIWNTLQNTAVGDNRDGFESIVILADGEPLSLDLTGWTAAAIGATTPVYTKPVASAADAYYEVTVDHLRLIAGARDLRIQAGGNQNHAFDLWDQQKAAKAAIRSFLDEAVY